MKLLLGFLYNSSNYYVVDDGTRIYLGKYDNRKFVLILDSEKNDLRNIIKILLSKKINQKELSQYNISILSTKQFELAGGLSDAIILELQGKQRKNFITNCKKLDSKNKNKFLGIFLLILLFIAIASAVIFFFVTSSIEENNKAKELLAKYTYKWDSNLNDIYNLKYQSANIANKLEENLFTDSYISFKNPYSNEFITTHYDILYSMNSYSGDPGLDVVYVPNNDSDPFAIYNLETLLQNYNISMDDVLTRNNIKTSIDLINKIVLNAEKQVDINSKEEEMIDHFVFDVLRPLVLPYDNSSQLNEMIIFQGDKKGYAHITDNTVTIVLENNLSQYKIIYNYLNSSLEKLTNSEIIDIVSTIQFNQ